ncbi:P protein [Drosophila grimshawi]|uniref:GH13602 n=1 Tax=Drosophila grimshawi TaxID=7222 RepID=B4JPX8_DROGR|nr:P protein [Drosophila grimshawi]EDV98958.1 GH13602 [Drosophila grimshawi]
MYIFWNRQENVPASNRTNAPRGNEQQQLPRSQIIRQTAIIIKISIFLVIWFFFTVFLIIIPPYEPSNVLVPLETQSPQVVRIMDEPRSDVITVEVKGPIDPDATLNPQLATKEQPHILVVVECFSEETNTTMWISKPWNVYLDETPQNHKHHVDEEDEDVGVTVKKYIHLEEIQNKWMQRDMQSISRRFSNKQLDVLLLNMHDETASLFVRVNPNPMDMDKAVVWGICLMLLLYVLIIWDIADRTVAALIVSTAAIAVLAMLGERPSLGKIISWIDMETLMLLFAMMIMIAILAETGSFDYLSAFAYQMSRGNILMLLFYLCMFTAFISAFLDNVTMVLLMVPVTIRLCESLELSTPEFVISIAIFSNIGGTFTPVGDPYNVLVATDPHVQKNGLNFGQFVLHMFPCVLISLLLSFGLFYLLIRNKLYNIHELQESLKALQKQDNQLDLDLERRINELQARLKKQQGKDRTNFGATLAEMKANCRIRNKTLFVKCCIAFAFAIILFFLHALMEAVTLCWATMLAAILLMILANRKDIDAVIEGVEWSTLIFFAALFVLTEALTEMGVMDFIGQCTIAIILSVDRSQQLLVSIMLVVWITALSSAVVDNIPLTAMMLKLVIKLNSSPELHLPFAPLIWSLLFGSSFGGNGTLIGASANVVAAGMASQHGYTINFRSFFVIGFPIMLMTVLLATIYLLIAHYWFSWHDSPNRS